MLNEHITIGKQSRHRVYVRDWQKKVTQHVEDFIESFLNYLCRKEEAKWLQASANVFSEVLNRLRSSNNHNIVRESKFFRLLLPLSP
jgi:hypothetical protein